MTTKNATATRAKRQAARTLGNLHTLEALHLLSEKARKLVDVQEQHKDLYGKRRKDWENRGLYDVPIEQARRQAAEITRLMEAIILPMADDKYQLGRARAVLKRHGKTCQRFKTDGNGYVIEIEAYQERQPFISKRRCSTCGRFLLLTIEAMERRKKYCDRFCAYHSPKNRKARGVAGWHPKVKAKLEARQAERTAAPSTCNANG